MQYLALEQVKLEDPDEGTVVLQSDIVHCVAIAESTLAITMN
jgi:hypothetical protein